MNIITISREFGSGGRELGKRLADILGYDYYDKEIITKIAQRHGLDENYVEQTLNTPAFFDTPLTYKHSFSSPLYLGYPKTSLLLEQKRVIDDIAKLGKNFIIVGRNADVLLREYNPFNIFVCAEMEEKIKRCIERAEEGENVSPKFLKRNIQRIDKNRKRTRFTLSDKDWGHRATYNVTVNTTGWDIKELSKSVAKMCESWFETRKEDN